ncbi:MAG: hypothetical protein GY710_20050 [Desulfobacteraceae bacterium]|nr:hypothetical protein [Desulfobacteraceae bacterium]
MKLLQWFGILCTALVISSCTFMQPSLPEVQIPPKRIFQKHYSLMPPNEEGWLIIQKDAYQLTLGKFGDTTDETFAIQIIPFRLPEFKTKDEFVHIIKENQIKKADPKRFKIIRHDVTSNMVNGTDCIKSHMVTEDSAAIKRSGNPKDTIMILEALTLNYAMPKDRTIGVSIIYSHRYYPENRDPAFIEKAMGVLNSFKFKNH